MPEPAIAHGTTMTIGPTKLIVSAALWACGLGGIAVWAWCDGDRRAAWVFGFLALVSMLVVLGVLITPMKR